MKDQDKTKEQLMEEMAEMRQRVTGLEASETGRKQTEEKLRESEEKLRRMFESVSDGIAVTDLDGVITDVNRQTVEMLGYASKDDLVGRSAFDLIAPVDRERAAVNMQRTLQDGRIEGLEYSLAKEDGSVFPGEMGPSVLRNASGEPTGFIAVTRDITERKKEEEFILTQSEVTRNMAEGAYIVGLDNIIIRYANPKFEEMFGYEPGEMVGKHASIVNAPTDKSPEERADEIMEVIRRTGEWHGEVHNIQKDGATFWCYANVSVFNHPRYGEVLLAVHTDITMRKQTEEKLRRSHEYLDRILNGMFDAVMVIDRDYNIRDVNDCCVRTYNSKKDDIIGKKCHEVTHGLPTACTGDEHPCPLRDILQTKAHCSLEHNHISRDGSELIVEVNAFPLMDARGEVESIVEVQHDITERKQAENTLRESEERFRNMANLLPLSVWEIDLENNFTFINLRGLQWYNPALAELPADVGRIEAALAFIPEDHERVRADTRRLLKGEDLGILEYTQLRIDGSTFPVQVIATPIIQEGNPVGLRGVTIDLTERKQAEEALREEKELLAVVMENTGAMLVYLDTDFNFIWVNDSYATTCRYRPEEMVGKNHFGLYPHEENQAIFARVRDTGRPETYYNKPFTFPDQPKRDVTYWDWTLTPVKDARGNVIGLIFSLVETTEHVMAEQELQRTERLESVGTLAGGIAHDFNNILTGIMGNISLAREHIEPESKVAERLLEAEKASLRAKDLTRQLLTFARGIAPVKKLVSIAELIEDSATFALRGSNVRCEFSFQYDLWPEEVDEGQMNQVITNLVLNADEAMPAGGILNIGIKNRVIQTRSTLPLPEGDYVEITIADHGVGISKEHLGKIFDPYFTTKQKGSGLGLSTAYSIIKNHDGHITVNSKLKVGTTFHIYLPASDKPVPVKKEAAAEIAVAGKGRILVMDDEEAIRELLHNQLTDIGYEVELTVDGTQAIEQYTQARESGQPFDAVILDLTIPGGVGGKEVIEKLLEIDPGVKAIVTSGYSTDPVMSAFREYGFSAAATKPYSISELAKTLRSLTGSGN